MVCFQSRAFVVALLALIVTTASACSGGTPTSPTQSGSPVARGSITVTLSGQVAGQGVRLVDSFVLVTGPTTPSSKKYEGGSLTFDNLLPGEYRITAEAFGFGMSEGKVSVSDSAVQIHLGLSPLSYDVKLLGLYANGVKIEGTEPVPTPVDLEVRVLVMNSGGGRGWAMALLQTQVGLAPVILLPGLVTSQPFSEGLQEASVWMRAFKPCTGPSLCYRTVQFVTVYTGPFMSNSSAFRLYRDQTYYFQVE